MAMNALVAGSFKRLEQDSRWLWRWNRRGSRDAIDERQDAKNAKENGRER